MTPLKQKFVYRPSCSLLVRERYARGANPLMPRLMVERPPKPSRPLLPRCRRSSGPCQESLRRPNSNDTLREQVATAQAESAALKGKAEALEAALDREVADRRTLQQQIDHVRRECQAAQERVVQAKAEILDERRRVQTTEDLVTRLKHELREIEQANKRRRWWFWR